MMSVLRVGCGALAGLNLWFYLNGGQHWYSLVVAFTCAVVAVGSS